VKHDSCFLSEGHEYGMPLEKFGKEGKMEYKVRVKVTGRRLVCCACFFSRCRRWRFHTMVSQDPV